MKCFVIRDEKEKDAGDLGWLFYDAASGRFFIELPEKKDPWALPPPLDSYARRGVFSVPSRPALSWVMQRIVPQDRQNLGMILKENGLKTYDPYRLLVLADGRCAQDDCFLTAVSEDALPGQIRERLRKKVLDVIPLAGHRAVVLFRDGTTRLVTLEVRMKEQDAFRPVLRDDELFMRLHVAPLGNGIEWDEARCIPAEELHRMGRKLPLDADDFLQFTIHRTLDTTELSERMHCTRQYIRQLTLEGRLHPVHSGKKYTLFLARDAE